MASRWAFMKKFVIEKDGEIYLKRRRIIQTPQFALYYHRFYRPDMDRDLHDHPWNFSAFILTGGYTEQWKRNPTQQIVNLRTWERWSYHKVLKTEIHSITSIKPGTRTLLFVGKRTREWGFWTEDGWVSWQQYTETSY